MWQYIGLNEVKSCLSTGSCFIDMIDGDASCEISFPSLGMLFCNGLKRVLISYHVVAWAAAEACTL